MEILLLNPYRKRPVCDLGAVCTDKIKGATTVVCRAMEVNAIMDPEVA